MEFILYCIDKPNRAALRSTLRVPHLRYVKDRQHVFRFGGPMLDDAGRPRGSLMILELPDRAALRAHMAGDPFFGGNLFESVTIWETRQVMPEAEPGGLQRELSAALHAAVAANPDSSGKGSSLHEPVTGSNAT